MLTVTCSQKKYMPRYEKKVNGETVWFYDYMQVLVRWLPGILGSEEGMNDYYSLWEIKNGDAANIPAVPERDRQYS